MLRSTSVRQWARLATSTSGSSQPPRFLAPWLARQSSSSPPSHQQSPFAHSNITAPHTVPGLPDRSTSVSQRPQKHKAKKAKGSKYASPLPTSDAASPSAALLPVGLRNPSPRRRPADGKVIALTTSESYDTAQLLQRLQAMGLLEDAVNLVGEAVLLPRWSPAAATFFDADTAAAGTATAATLQEQGEVYVFESGTVVLWGLSMDAAEVFLRKVIRGGLGTSNGFVEQGRYAEPETEVLEYWVGQDGPTHMSGDSIHLSSPISEALPALSETTPTTPSKSLLERLAFSAGMARVTKLGVYEEQFDAFAEGVAGIPKLLESGSESPVKKTDIIKRVGTLHSFRQKLNLEDENLLDEPEFLWEDADLHGHYTAVCKALEFENRLTTLNDRVDYAFSLQTTLMELLNAKTSHRLEWIIIILIAFEISLVLIREGLPFLNSHEKPKEAKEAAQA